MLLVHPGIRCAAHYEPQTSVAEHGLTTEDARAYYSHRGDQGNDNEMHLNAMDGYGRIAMVRASRKAL